ncbi:MAG: DUF883 family protein [bacterium]
MNHVEHKEKLIQDVKEVLSDAETLIRETAGELSGKAREAHGRLAKKLEEAKQRMKEVESVVKTQAIEKAKETDRLIREHPYESIGVSFLVGLLIGALVNGK